VSINVNDIVSVKDLPRKPAGVSDALVGISSNPADPPFLAPFDQLPIPAAMQAALDALAAGQSAGQLVYRTWPELSAVTGSVGVGAQVIGDAGTHTDPVVGGTVANAGQYVWSASPPGWRWVRADLLPMKADATQVEALAAGEFDNFRIAQMGPESGYLWALADQAGRSPIRVAVDGTVEMAKAAVGDARAVPLSPETGYAWAVVDLNNRIGLGLKQDGTVVGKGLGGGVAPDASPYITPTKNLWCIGDSMTAGAGGQVTWRQVIEANNPARAVTNAGIGGQTSPQIAARVGAYVSLVTAAGDSIPASGGVVLTDLSIKLLSTPADNSGGTRTIPGWLGGVYGTLSCLNATTGDADDVYTFTRQSLGAQVYLAPGSPFVPDTGTRAFDVLIVFVGRNNLSDVETIKRDIARCVGLQKTVEKRFLIITPPNGGTTTPGQSTAEGTGSSTLANIKAVEQWAVQEYGDRVLLSRPYSWQFHNGSADDLDDVAKETVPRSLRIDGVHWTTAFHAQIAAWVQNELNRRNW